MLTDLTIRNLALIEEARLSFGGGLNAITGETGAGKSLLVAALELLSGERLRRGSAASLVRDGEQRADVEGRFTLVESASVRRVEECLRRELPAFLPEWEELAEHGERELLLARSVEEGGRSRAWINHRPVTRAALRAVARTLFEIHGQNSHQELLEPWRQVELLDAGGGCAQVRVEYGEARAAWRRLNRSLEQGRAAADERRQRIELLRYRIEELDTLEPDEGDFEALRSEREQLRHAAVLARESAGWADALSEGESAAIDRMRCVERELERWAEKIATLGEVRAELEQARLHLEEAAAAILAFGEDVELDPRRLEQVESRLAEYDRLARVHAVEPGLLWERSERLVEELAALEEVEGGLDSLERECEASLSELVARADRLTEARRAASGELVAKVQRALRGLGLAKARLEVAILPGPEGSFGELGRDTVEFRLAANPGEPFRPLSEVASGGETARIALALQSALADVLEARVLVFDEIDTGVGGRLGPALGEHLRRLGEHHQVLTVTHLPAIAAAAHRHQVVRKAVRRGRTRTAVALLEGDARVAEVADMIAGGATAATAQAEARRLLAAVAG